MAERQRDRRHQDRYTEPSEEPVGATGPRLSDISAETWDLLRSGDEIIARSLSGDASLFLEQMRQQGGE